MSSATAQMAHATRRRDPDEAAIDAGAGLIFAIVGDFEV
jgi:hypothetical protein